MGPGRLAIFRSVTRVGANVVASKPRLGIALCKAPWQRLLTCKAYQNSFIFNALLQNSRRITGASRLPLAQDGQGFVHAVGGVPVRSAKPRVKGSRQRILLNICKVNTNVSIRSHQTCRRRPIAGTVEVLDAAVSTLRQVVGTRIRSLRKAADLTQDQLADLMDTDAPLIGRYERGVTMPSVEQLIKLATVLKVSPAELLPDQHDEIRERIISLRRKISDYSMLIDSPEDLQKVLDFMEVLRHRVE